MIELKGTYNQDCKIFIDEVETEAIELIRNILNQEISTGVQVRIMPDTHVGKGIVIGFTMPVTRMVNPNYIGVDIGCSVTTFKLNQRIEEERFPTLDHAIRRSIPMGMHIRKEKNLDDWWITPYFETVNNNLHAFQQKWFQRFGETKDSIQVDKEYISRLCKKIGIKESTFYCSVGTLGGGNHFIELGESAKDGSHYLTIHSGSRHFGLKVCNYHAKKMHKTTVLPEEYHEEFKFITRNTLPTSDIPKKLEELNKRYHVGKKEYMLEKEDMYEYLVDMVIAQTYAQFNHKAMAKAIFKDLGENYQAVDTVYSMHNFIDTTDWIIRKGAIRAYQGEKMVIPFNMRDGLLICEGKSNPDWNCSAPHGAGRIMKRVDVGKHWTLSDYKKEMKGIYSPSISRRTLDEAPFAYRSLEEIRSAAADAVSIEKILRPVYNFKAGEEA